jgi:hypothetical protein
MIQFYDSQYKNELIKLILENNIESKKVRYLENDVTAINYRLQDRLSREDFKVLLNIVDEKIDSYMELNVIQEDKYLQIASFISFKDFDKSLDEFFRYISIQYKGYEIHYVVGDYNIDAIQYMDRLTVATSDGLETMLHITKEYISEFPSCTCNKLQEVDYEEFINLHNKNFPNVYWDGLKLVHSSIFDIFIEKKDDKLTKYAVVSKRGKSEEEIYFHYSTPGYSSNSVIDCAVKSSLVKSNSVQILLDNKEHSIQSSLIRMGFKIKEKIITYHIESLT